MPPTILHVTYKRGKAFLGLTAKQVGYFNCVREPNVTNHIRLINLKATYTYRLQLSADWLNRAAITKVSIAMIARGINSFIASVLICLSYKQVYVYQHTLSKHTETLDQKQETAILLMYSHLL